MRRATLLLASSLAAAAVAGAFLYAPRSPVDNPARPAATSAPDVAHQESPQPQPAAPAEAEPNVSVPTPSGDTAEQAARNAALKAYEEAVRRRGPQDEATVLADLRNGALRDIQQSYLLLLDDLGLTPREKEDLIAVLVELQVDSAWSLGGNGDFVKRGRTIGPQERHERIAAAIGDEKLDEFLLLEVNHTAYWEAQQIAALLRRKGVPITKAQRDGLFEIVAEVRDRYPQAEPDVDSSSFEWIEQTLAQMDDFDRHVVELAPSVLSATQVAHVSDEYQWMAQQRLNDVNMQTKRRAERPGEDVGWALSARWNPH